MFPVVFSHTVVRRLNNRTVFSWSDCQPSILGRSFTRCAALCQQTDSDRDRYKYRRFKQRASNAGVLGVAAAAVVSAFTVGVWWRTSNKQRRSVVLAAANTSTQLAQKQSLAGERRADLPDFSLQDVAEHDSPERRVWLTYRAGVYDITDFVRKHPGGRSIMMAAGGAADPFWTLYGVHQDPHVLQLLERFRIGNLSPQDAQSSAAEESSVAADLWSDEPRRHPALRPSSARPFNAEPPPQLLDRSFFTPNDLFYVRNHLPVPNLSADDYTLEVDCSGAGEDQETPDNCVLNLSLDSLRRDYEPVTVDAAVMCAGNRRSEMSAVKKVRGLNWQHAAVGNARWTGVRLRDVLLRALATGDNRDAHITTDGRLSGPLSHVRHVCFDGADTDAGGSPYGASIPLETALDPAADVLLVYEMNGQPLSRDHGFPLRVLVPGTVGARSVKWLSRVYLSADESTSHWQRRDYKGFSPSVDWDTVNFDQAPAIQQLPVNSAFCWPADGVAVRVTKHGKVRCSGYAWSGGGRRVVRVDVSADGGRSWQEATLDSREHQQQTPAGRCWSWSLWSAELPVPDDADSAQLCVKAVDDSYNTQPENVENIWNLRGVLSNAYHRVNVRLKRKPN